MPDADIDKSLLAAIQEGDRAALAELYDRYAALILAVAYRILKNRGDAEDLLHDIFLESWQKADTYNPSRGTVKTWLLLRTRSQAIDRLRTLTVAREHGLMQSAAAPELPTANNDPSLAPDCRRARQAFEQLPEGQRLVVQLGYFEGLTCQEIATRCDIPLGTVKSRLAAAIMKLRKILSSHWEHADATR